MSAVLSLRGVYKDFDGVEVIRGVDMEIEAGERHAIIGPNGAGKTTLTNLITGKYRPSRGTIAFRGADIAGLSPHRLARRGIGRSFQIINVFREMTVFENLRNAVLSRHGIRVNVRRRLSALHDVHDETERIGDLVGLRTSRDQLASALPYGAQRALEIGLVLALQPELILLDEPAAGMSAAETRELTSLIRRVSENKTLILIEHDMEVVFSVADRISVLHYGEVLTRGAPDEIRRNPQVKDVYLGYREQASADA